MLITGRFSEVLEAQSLIYETPVDFKYALEFSDPNFPTYSEVKEFLGDHCLHDDEVCVVVNCFGRKEPQNTSWYKVVSLVFNDRQHQILAKLKFCLGRVTDYPMSEPTIPTDLAID
jgi:hypothetical protein